MISCIYFKRLPHISCINRENIFNAYQFGQKKPCDMAPSAGRKPFRGILHIWCTITTPLYIISHKMSPYEGKTTADQHVS